MLRTKIEMGNIENKYPQRGKRKQAPITQIDCINFVTIWIDKCNCVIAMKVGNWLAFKSKVGKSCVIFLRVFVHSDAIDFSLIVWWLAIWKPMWRCACWYPTNEIMRLNYEKKISLNVHTFKTTVSTII